MEAKISSNLNTRAPESFSSHRLGSTRRGKVGFVFDLEGTLVNLEGYHQKAFEQVAQQSGVTFGPNEFKSFVGAGDKIISEEMERLLETNGKKVDPQTIRRTKAEVYHEMLASHPGDIVAREGVHTYLEKALQLTDSLAIASITPEEDAHRIMEAAGLLPYFAVILTEKSVSHNKPDPEVYVKAAELLDLSPENILVHEDSPAGVKAAKAAGSKVVAFPVHENLAFDPQPDKQFSSWTEPGVDPEKLSQKLFNIDETALVN